METPDAIKQLERSERGQQTCKLLLDFLNSPAVKFLDGRNQTAVAMLVNNFMLGSSADACAVVEALEGVVNRNQWVKL